MAAHPSWLIIPIWARSIYLDKCVLGLAQIHSVEEKLVQERGGTAMIPRGSGQMQATLDGVPFDVYTYKPNSTIKGILLIYHGTSRTADSYRDYAIDLADLGGLVVAAPLFDKARFRIRDYHRGGLVDRSGNLKPASQWTTRFVPLLADWVRTQVAEEKLPYWCWGHSAGAQFLSRVAAFEQPDARRIVLANASSYVLPLLGLSRSISAQKTTIPMTLYYP
jgi:alpha-beta hydrolase superfamily lysophospholipase